MIYEYYKSMIWRLHKDYITGFGLDISWAKVGNVTLGLERHTSMGLFPVITRVPDKLPDLVYGQQIIQIRQPHSQDH